MKLLIVGLGSMGKRRARLSKGIDAALHIVGVDTAETRRAEACTLGLADAAYPTIAEAVAAAKAKGIDVVVFDRGGYLYHGRVAELAEGAREGGLEF